MSAIVTAVGDIFTWAIGCVSSVATTITASGNEVLLFFALIPVCMIGVDIFRRLINVN